MKDIPIIFSGPMVCALLAGRKTMTRRLAWRDAKFGLQDYASEQLEDMELRGWDVVGEGDDGLFRAYKPTAWQNVTAGDRLWVRENYAPRYFDGGKHGYGADWSESSADVVPRPKWTPCIHMPRTASRLTLIVTGIKVERLQDLSEADAIAEGVSRIGGDMPWAVNSFKDGPNFYSIDMGAGSLNQPTAAGTFALLWKVLHGEEAWDENPEVVAISFEVVRANIDEPEAKAAA